MVFVVVGLAVGEGMESVYGVGRTKWVGVNGDRLHTSASAMLQSVSVDPCVLFALAENGNGKNKSGIEE